MTPFEYDRVGLRPDKDWYPYGKQGSIIDQS